LEQPLQVAVVILEAGIPYQPVTEAVVAVVEALTPPAIELV
jgi:hypothetical protein